MRLDAGSADKKRVAKSDLHEHQHHGEHHPRNARQELARLVAQLAPRKLKRDGHIR